MRGRWPGVGVVVLPALLLLLSPAAFAAAADLVEPLVESEPFALPADELLALARQVAEAESPPDEAAVDLLLLEIRHDVAADGTAVYQRREVYRLLTADAVDVWGSVETGWTSWIQERPELDARVVTPRGREVRLDSGTVVDGAADAGAGLVYSDQRHARAPLPALEVGAVVELVVRVEDTRSMLPDGGVVRRAQLYSAAPIRRARLVIEGPADQTLRWRVLGKMGEMGEMGEVGEPVETEPAPGRVRLTFDLTDRPAWEYVAGRPPEVPLGPTVDFSFDASWNGVARVYAQVVERQLAGLAPDAPLLAGSGESQWDMIAARLADLHRRLRYTSVALGDSGIVPRTPPETLERGYGDCKDLSLLLVASLRRDGVPAYLALLRASPGSDDVQPQVPGFGLFDHAIVYVPGSPALWIDPTDPHSRLGDLPPSVEGRHALVVTPETTDLTVIPRSPSSEHRLEETRTFHLAERGLGRLVEESHAFGHQGRSLRASWADLSAAELDESLGQYGRDNYAASDVVSVDVEHLADLSKPLVSRVEVAESLMLATDDIQAIALVDPSDLFVDLPYDLRFTPDEDAGEGEDEETRKVDYVLGNPHRMEHRYRVPIPPGFEVAELPRCPERELGAATLDCTVEEVDGEVRIDLLFDTRGPRYTPEQVTAMRTEVGAIDETFLTLTLDRTAARLAREGRSAEAVAEHRRLAALHPDEALHPALLSGTLLELGLRDAAVEEARRATELEPESPFAWFQLGFVLMHDEVGRDLVPGFRRDEALVALRKARELDPEDVDIALNLAQLLAFGPEADVYRPGPELDEAVELLTPIQEDLAGTQFADNLYHFQVAADRFEALEEALGEDPGTASRWALYLVARSLQGEVEAAARSAARSFASDRDAWLGVAGQAAGLLLSERAYDEGAALFGAMAKHGTRHQEIQALAQMMEQLERVDPTGPVEVTDPVAPVPRARAILVRLAGRATDGQRLWTDELAAVQAAESATWAEEFADGVELGLANRLGGLDVDTGLATDVMALLDGTAQGAAAHGYRVRLTQTGLGGGEEVVVHLAPRDGELLLAALDSDSRALAAEARHWLNRGDLDTARWWLDELEDALDFDGNPLVAGVGAGLDGDDPEEIRAALDRLDVFRRLFGDDTPDAEELARLDAVAEGFDDPADGQTFRMLLAGTAAGNDDFDRAFELLDAVVALDPDNTEDDRREELRARLLYAAGRYDRAIEVVEAALDDDLAPAQERTFRVLRAQSLMARGDTDLGVAELRAVAAEPGLPGPLWNEIAWLALVAGEVDDTTVGWAERAVRSMEAPGHAVVHTLASLYAADGRLADAHRALAQVYSDRGAIDVRSVDWWVYGRIAEELGLNDTAARFYRRVLEGDDRRDRRDGGEPAGLSFASTGQLAQRALDRLAAGGASSGGG